MARQRSLSPTPVQERILQLVRDAIRDRGEPRFDTEIRRIVCTTNAIESVNARIRRAVKARGHFPNEQAALKCVYMAIMSLGPTGKGQARWTMRWKTALNAFDGRLTAARQ
jgi:transposase-like protein